MRTIGRWTQWKRLLVAAPLSALALMSAGWSNNLRPLHQGMDPKELGTDSEYMARVYEAKGRGGERGFIDIDLADEAQHRFVLNRLRAAGKTAENAPFLFKRLEDARQRAVARRSNPDKSSSTASLETTAPWGCEHYVTLSPGTTSGTNRAYQSGPVGSCQGGANYIYADVLFHNSNLAGTDRVVVDSASGEQYAGGTNFNTVAVNPALPLSATRQADVDSMMIAMNDSTGEEVLTFLRNTSGSTVDPARVQLQHPSFANPAEGKQNISLCQLRGGSDCDYAVVSNQSGTLVPWSSNPTGVAQRLTPSPWTGNTNAFFPFHSGVGFDYQHVFVPARFGFDAGSGTTACVISSVNPGTRMRLTKNGQGGQCGSSEDIHPFLPVGARTSNLDRLLNFNRNTTVPQSAGADCSMSQITNENVEVSLTVNVTADCGQGPETRLVTYRSRVHWGWNLYVLNSCMAEGTGIERADGSIAPVEQVRVGDKVVANNKGLVLTVTDVQRGGEDKPLVHLRSDKGHDVRLTTEHPVLLASGKVVKAEQVKVKDRVRTRDGVASIVSYTRVPYDGQVYNLTLGTPEELAKVSKEDRTLFAGGFQVGDSSMQFDLTAPVVASSDVFSRLPASWHRDFKRRPAAK